MGALAAGDQDAAVFEQDGTGAAARLEHLRGGGELRLTGAPTGGRSGAHRGRADQHK